MGVQIPPFRMNEVTPPSNICGEVLTRVPAQRAAGRERDLYLTGGAAGQAPASLWRPSGSPSEAKGPSNEASCAQRRVARGPKAHGLHTLPAEFGNGVSPQITGSIPVPAKSL